MSNPQMPEVSTAPMSGRDIIGDVTEAIKKFVKDGWTESTTLTIEERLDKTSMGKTDQFAFIYMYRLAHNPNLQNRKRLRQAPVFLNDSPESGNVYLHRPPLLVDLYYLITAHAQFPSETAKILGWLLLRLNEATHLIYRPRKFILPNGNSVDSLGREYDPNIPLTEEKMVIEKVSLALVDDLSVGDAINMFSLHEAPYRPFLTYRARIAIDGPLVHAPNGTRVVMDRAKQNSTSPTERHTRPNGRPVARTPASKVPEIFGETPHKFRRDTDDYDDYNN
jgi:hypothetical protein